jgi:succinate dehydrogenase/fumarate reductase flavoprotein subunit
MLDAEAFGYLEKSGALADTPVARLLRLNEPAVELFRDHRIDLTTDKLEIAVCAQHNNGGLRANVWWESNLRHLFPVGEVCGTHGVRRPGGAALNAGQVGSLRAALYIAKNYDEPPLELTGFRSVVESQVDECIAFCTRVCDARAEERTMTPASVISEVQLRMSRVAGHVRAADQVRDALAEAWHLARRVRGDLRISGTAALPVAFRAVDLCVTHVLFLEAISEYLSAGGQSRGSAIVLDPSGDLPTSTLGDSWRFRMNEADARVDEDVLEIHLDAEDRVVKRWVPTRPLPDPDQWFEVMWREYRSGRTIE